MSAVPCIAFVASVRWRTFVTAELVARARWFHSWFQFEQTQPSAPLHNPNVSGLSHPTQPPEAGLIIRRSRVRIPPPLLQKRPGNPGLFAVHGDLAVGSYSGWVPRLGTTWASSGPVFAASTAPGWPVVAGGNGPLFGRVLLGLRLVLSRHPRRGHRHARSSGLRGRLARGLLSP
jgi:hypothetical protein